MFSHLSTTNLIEIGLASILIYLVIVGMAFKNRLLTLIGLPQVSHKNQLAEAIRPLVSSHPHELLPPLLDKPALHPAEQAKVFEPDNDEDGWVMEDFEDNTLLLEAERVVEKIQDVVSHIASYPANPDEVFSKIHAIISPYAFFKNTEYYEAINSFVAITVQRDCDLVLTAEDLQALWYENAA